MTTADERFLAEQSKRNAHVEIRDNCDGTFTVSEPTGEYDAITVRCEFEAMEEAEAMADDTGLPIVKT